MCYLTDVNNSQMKNKYFFNNPVIIITLSIIPNLSNDIHSGKYPAAKRTSWSSYPNISSSTVRFKIACASIDFANKLRPNCLKIDAFPLFEKIPWNYIIWM